MAALGFENPSSDNVYVVAEVNKAQHVLCSLQSGKIPQQILNLNFTEGELVSFFIEGQGVVHLTGFLTLDDNDSETDSSDEDEKGEPKGDVLLQKEDVRNVISSYIHKNGLNNEKVSNLSWQGILSGSQEGNGDEIGNNRYNGDSKINYMNGESCKVNQDSDNNSMLAEERKTNNTVVNNGIFPNDDVNSGGVISDNFSDNDIHENGISNDEVTNRVGEASYNSSDEKSSICSVESETRYLLADNNSHKKNKRNTSIDKTTSPTKKTGGRSNDNQGSPRKKKANFNTLEETQQDDSDNNNKRKPPTKGTSKETPLKKRNYGRTNSSKVKDTPNKKTASKRNSKLTPNKDSSIKDSPSKSSRQSSVKQGKLPSVKNQLRSERLRTMRKRKANDQADT